MRRYVAISSLIAVVFSIAGAVPASATHCKADASIQTCPNPATLIVIEGIGNVCATAGDDVTLADKARYAATFNKTTHPAEVRAITSRCTFKMDDPTWVDKPISNWRTNPPQGLYWPGRGPGAVGPTLTKIDGTPSPPTRLCVSNVGGQGCSIRSVGMLMGGDTLATATGRDTIGAHCGSSHGRLVSQFISGDNTVSTWSQMEWDQSAATILPMFGTVTETRIRGVVSPPPSGNAPSVISFVSARGVGGSGTCGIGDATTGFQVEGFTLTY